MEHIKCIKLDLLRTFRGHINTVYSLEWINEDTIASGSFDQTIKVWSVSTGQTNITINASSIIFSLKLLNNGFYLASALSNGKIKIYNVNDKGNLIATLEGHTSNVRDLSLISNDLLASSSGYPDQTIRIWNLTTNATKFILKGHANSVYGLRLISSDILASGSADNSTKLWNTTSGTLIRTLKNHTNYIYWSIDLINFYNNSQTQFVLVSGSMDQTIKIWNCATSEIFNTVNTTVIIQTLSVLNPLIEGTKTTQRGKYCNFTLINIFVLCGSGAGRCRCRQSTVPVPTVHGTGADSPRYRCRQSTVPVPTVHGTGADSPRYRCRQSTVPVPTVHGTGADSSRYRCGQFTVPVPTVHGTGADSPRYRCRQSTVPMPTVHGTGADSPRYRCRQSTVPVRTVPVADRRRCR
jgi:WD40 repeat protein